MKCPECGKFVKDVEALVEEVLFIDEKKITKVTGVCAKHGKVDLTNEDWSYEEFFPNN